MIANREDFNFLLTFEGTLESRCQVIWEDLPAQSVGVGDTLTFRYSDYVSGADTYYEDGVEGDGTLRFTPTTTEMIQNITLTGKNSEKDISANAVLEIDRIEGFYTWVLDGKAWVSGVSVAGREV